MSDTNDTHADSHADPHADPVVVGIYDTEFEAALIKNMLSEAGIPAQMVGAMTAGFRAETPGKVKVLVPGSLGEQAMALIAQDAESRE
tara:strand:- start:1338 stop:1601 length:264 start_codon:yes stop_codon:yes gene_type:complete